MLRQLRFPVLLLLLSRFVSAQDAFAVDLYTDLTFGSGVLSGYSTTYLDVDDGEEEYCEEWISAYGGYCRWWGLTVPWVYTSGNLYRPSTALHYSNYDFDYEESIVVYNVSAPEEGTWTARGAHYVGWDYWREQCTQYSCGGYNFQYDGDALLDELDDTQYVPPLPPTWISWNPTEFTAPGCTAVNFDEGLDAVDIEWYHEDDNVQEIAYNWSNGGESCVDWDEDYKFGTYQIVRVRNAAGGDWAIQNPRPTVIIREPTQYDVRMNAFIPYAWVSDGTFCSLGQVAFPTILHGDDRTSFDRNGAFRIRAYTTLRPDAGNGTAGAVIAGESGRYERFSSVGTDTTQTVVPAQDTTMNDCYKTVQTDHADLSDIHSITTGSASAKQASIHFYGYATEPFNPLAPAIDFDVLVTISKAGSTPHWSLTYTHDCFPAFEVYIGATQIYGRMPYSGSFTEIGLCLSGQYQGYSNFIEGDL